MKILRERGLKGLFSPKPQNLSWHQVPNLLCQSPAQGIIPDGSTGLCQHTHHRFPPISTPETAITGSLKVLGTKTQDLHFPEVNKALCFGVSLNPIHFTQTYFITHHKRWWHFTTALQSINKLIFAVPTFAPPLCKPIPTLPAYLLLPNPLFPPFLEIIFSLCWGIEMWDSGIFS